MDIQHDSNRQLISNNRLLLLAYFRHSCTRSFSYWPMTRPTCRVSTCSINAAAEAQSILMAWQTSLSRLLPEWRPTFKNRPKLTIMNSGNLLTPTVAYTPSRNEHLLDSYFGRFQKDSGRVWFERRMHQFSEYLASRSLSNAATKTAGAWVYIFFDTLKSSLM